MAERQKVGHAVERPLQDAESCAVAIVATCYNEDEKLFDDSMTSIVKNIQHLQSRTKSKTWGAKSWEKIVVCIVADGRAKIHPKMLKYAPLESCGVSVEYYLECSVFTASIKKVSPRMRYRASLLLRISLK